MKRCYLAPFEAGYFVSDEPGCYKDGEFGVRIESDLLACPADTPYKMGGRPFLKFEYMTLVPMCRKLVDVALLSPTEERWIDNYHARVWDALKDADCMSQMQKDWLWRSTRPL